MLLPRLARLVMAMSLVACRNPTNPGQGGSTGYSGSWGSFVYSGSCHLGSFVVSASGNFGAGPPPDCSPTAPWIVTGNIGSDGTVHGTIAIPHDSRVLDGTCPTTSFCSGTAGGLVFSMTR